MGKRKRTTRTAQPPKQAAQPVPTDPAAAAGARDGAGADAAFLAELEKPAAAAAEQTPPADEASAIPWFRRCPVCFGRMGGVGVSQSNKGGTRYYKCVRAVRPGGSPCGFNWTAQVVTEVVQVEHRRVDIRTR